MAMSARKLDVQISPPDRKEQLVQLKGSLSLMNAGTARTQIMENLDAATEVLTIQLSETEHIDSSGIGLLAALNRTMNTRHGRVVLSGTPSRIREMFELTGVDELFEYLD